MSGGVVRELSEAEVKCMLLSVAWRNGGRKCTKS